MKQNIGDKAFVAALLAITCVIVPFLYYAKEIFFYAHENKIKGFKYPMISQLWMTVFGYYFF